MEQHFTHRLVLELDQVPDAWQRADWRTDPLVPSDCGARRGDAIVWSFGSTTARRCTNAGSTSVCRRMKIAKRLC